MALRLKSLSLDHHDARTLDPGLEVGMFKIRLAAEKGTRREADSFVAKRYASRGYRISPVLAASNVNTFAAYDGGRLAGTVSLCLDSKEGLNADLIYRNEIDSLRVVGYRVCEFTRLAVGTSPRSQPVLGGLFHTAYLFALNRGFDYVVIEVNPRHVGYYKHSLGFSVIGEERRNPRVNAPAVLMGISLQTIADNIRRRAGKQGRAPRARSPYAYAFSRAEEMGVLGRLKSLERNAVSLPIANQDTSAAPPPSIDRA